MWVNPSNDFKVQFPLPPYSFTTHTQTVANQSSISTFHLQQNSLFTLSQGQKSWNTCTQFSQDFNSIRISVFLSWGILSSLSHRNKTFTFIHKHSIQVHNEFIQNVSFTLIWEFHILINKFILTISTLFPRGLSSHKILLYVQLQLQSSLDLSKKFTTWAMHDWILSCSSTSYIPLLDRLVTTSTTFW